MNRRVRATMAAATLWTGPLFGQVPLPMPSAPPAGASAAADLVPAEGDVFVFRTAGQPERRVKVVRLSGADGEALADVQDVGTGARYTLPVKVLTAMMKAASRPPVAERPSPPPSVPTPAAKPIEQAAMTPAPTPPPALAPGDAPRAGDVFVFRTAGQPERRVKVVRVSMFTDGESQADVQDLATGARYAVPGRVLMAMMAPQAAAPSKPAPPPVLNPTPVVTATPVAPARTPTTTPTPAPAAKPLSAVPPALFRPAAPGKTTRKTKTRRAFPPETAAGQRPARLQKSPAPGQ